MSTPYELGGYTNLKRRTREALVAAARDLVARGLTPTVEEVAAAAAVSRTTAYRYFPNQTALLVAAHPEVGARSLLEPDASALDPAARLDPVARLDIVIDRFLEIILTTESQQRTMLRISLDTDKALGAELPLRQGRAIAWIAEALEPLRGLLTPLQIHQLALAIRSAVGIEALVWLCDVAGLSRSEAAELMRWSARSLLQAALTSGPPPGGDPQQVGHP